MPPVLLDPRQLQRILNYLGWSSSPPKEPRPVRIGILGASSVASYAMLNPARLCGVDVVAVAARDPARAVAYAKQHKIARAHSSYEDLLADEEVEAVYVGLPNALHGQWAAASLRAGKHGAKALADIHPAVHNTGKSPFPPKVQELAREQGLLCREAFHYREHPLMQHMLELMQEPAGGSSSRVSGSSGSYSGSNAGSSNSGVDKTKMATNNSSSHVVPWCRPGNRSNDSSTLATKWSIGPLKQLDVDVLIPRWVFGGANIRWQETLGGGAMMDAGSYCANAVRTLSGAQPTVTCATAKLVPGSTSVDAEMVAQLAWPSSLSSRRRTHQTAGHANADDAGTGTAASDAVVLKGTIRASLQYDGLLPVTEIRASGNRWARGRSGVKRRCLPDITRREVWRTRAWPDRGSLICRGFVVPFFGHSVTITRVDGDQNSQHQQSIATTTGVRHGNLLSEFQQQVQLALHLNVSDKRTVLQFYGAGQRTTYQHQLERFAADVQKLREGSAATTDPGFPRASLEDVTAAMVFDERDSVNNMQLIDEVYSAAGLPLRTPYSAGMHHTLTAK